MIRKRLIDITPADLEALLANSASESVTLEFKRSVFGNNDADKKEFLADVSAFANSAGGDLIFGIEEKEGVANAITGLGITDVDGELLRISDLINFGIQPRLRYEAGTFDCGGKTVLLLRIEKSWNPPHRVTLKGHDKFYARTSTGKFPMDVQQLRHSFTESATVEQNVRNFRTNRLIDISRNETPVEMKPGSKLVMHLLPLEAFAGSVLYELGSSHTQLDKFQPMNVGGCNERITLEGRLAFSEISGVSESYIHLYRSGIIEAVDATVLNYTLPNGRKNLPSVQYERIIIEKLPGYLKLIEGLGVQPPILLGLSLTEVKGAQIGIDSSWRFTSELRPITQQNLVLPEVIYSNYTESPSAAIRPSFDLVWNACGLPKSRNFDQNGDWRPPRGY